MKQNISVPALKRLPVYFRMFSDAMEDGKEYISSQEIADAIGIDQTQVRKDITSVGYVGKPKIGFEIKGFIDHMKTLLKVHKPKKAIIVGIGNLGIAIARYKGFTDYGLKIEGMFDVDPQKIGLKIRDCEIRTFAEVHGFIKSNDIDIAILTVSSHDAQEVANSLISSGIKAIWNFTTVHLKTPKDVIVADQDLIAGLMMMLLLIEQSDSGTEERPVECEQKVIYLCMGSACHQHGAYNVLNEIKGLLNSHSMAGKVELKGAFCLGNCAKGINAKIGDIIVSDISPENVKKKFGEEILPLIS